ncbi:COP9 signalosome complex subunit 4 [Xylographa trunciseda]|nr:COP9 signalosome complex subunit 4 [Xylographa trunciseda]
MASPVVLSRIVQLESPITPITDKPAVYQNLLQQIIADSSPDDLTKNLCAFIDSVLGDTLGIVAARPLIGAYVEVLRGLPSLDVRIESGRYTLDALQSRVVSFEEQDASIREILADAFQEQEDYVEAAKILQGLQLESSQRKVPDEVKVRTWIRICRLYLEEDDTTSAESYLNRAKNLLYKVEDKELNLMFQLSQARILDSRRKFLEASQAYHVFSLSLALAEEERAFALSKAIICAVLAPAGPQRSRALGKLFKDERAVQLDEFGILEKMFLDRLISTQEVTNFAKKLAPHQLAQTADGSTVLAKAVIEHNLLGTSRLYNNISVVELGNLLGLDAAKSEEYAARMLEQMRLVGRIDQIDGVIFFGGQDGSGDKGTINQANKATDHGVRRWDRNVQGLAEDVERVSSFLQSIYPVHTKHPIQA